MIYISEVRNVNRHPLHDRRMQVLTKGYPDGSTQLQILEKLSGPYTPRLHKRITDLADADTTWIGISPLPPVKRKLKVLSKSWL